MKCDPINDYLNRLIDRFGKELEDDVVMLFGSIASEVRRDWAGDRPYIAHNGEDAGEVISARNRAILSDWQKGERISFLARRYKISRQRVWQIVKKV